MTDLKIPEHLSYSQVSTILRCGEQYRLERGLGIKSRPMWAGVGGKAVHIVSEVFDRHLIETGDVMSDDDVRAEFRKRFDEQINEDAERSSVDPSLWYASGRASKAYPAKENMEWWDDMGPSFCLSWKSWRMTAPWDVWIDPSGRPAIEYAFDIVIAGQRVKGFIDRVMVHNGQLIVLDLKTNSRTPESTMQLGTYREALWQQDNVSADIGTYWMARSGSTTMPQVLTEWSRERLDFTYGEADHRRKNGRLLAAPSNMCSACGVREYCYAVGGSKVNVVPSPFASI
jgi:putative RecB family exonuclease